MKTHKQYDYSKLEDKFQKEFKWNKARVFLFVRLVIGILTIGQINLMKLANIINSKATQNSNFRRIQRFLTNFDVDFNVIAKFMKTFLGDEKLILILDRTNWKFGKTNINILMLAIAYKGMAIPIFWNLLDKKGNSNFDERKEIIEKFLKLFDVEQIKVLVADREFKGIKWFKWLDENKVPFAIRVPNSSVITGVKGKKSVKTSFRFLKRGGVSTFKKPKLIYEQKLYVTGMLLDELSVILSNYSSNTIADDYKKRWEIETLFGAYKSRGFNLEKTHLQDRDKIAKLLAVMAVTFVWAYIIGEWLNEKKPIKIKKHGRLEKSLFRYGLDYLNNILACIDGLQVTKFRTVCGKLSCT